LRVVLVSYFSQSIAGGVASVANNVARSLNDKLDLHVICEKGGIQDRCMRLHEFPDAWISHGRFLGCHLWAKKIARMIEEVDPDVIHANYVHMLYYVSRVVKGAYPVVVTAHATPYRELEALLQHPTAGWELAAGFSIFPYWHLVDRAVLRDSDLIIAVSPLVKQDLIQVYHLSPNKIVVVPNGVDTDRFFPKEREQSDERRVLSVGRLVHRKGFSQLIRAIRRVCSHEKGVHLRIVGTGPELSSLRILTASLGLTNNIEFLGKVTEDRLASEYQNSELVVMPSTYEPCSMVTLEAMSSGTPVAMSPYSGVARLVHNDQCYVAINLSNFNSMAEDLIDALRNRDRLQELGKKSRMVVERRFSLEATAAQLVNVYESALEGRSD
jgi:glycosyltransferase involved in cell wall biosynthesis